jgi:hypothetical protein
MVKYYRLSLKHFFASYISIRICQHLSKVQLRDQRIRDSGKRACNQGKDNLTQVDNKAKNLIDVLSEGGIASNRSGYFVKQIEDLDVQAGQLREEPEPVGFEVPCSLACQKVA